MRGRTRSNSARNSASSPGRRALYHAAASANSSIASGERRTTFTEARADSEVNDVAHDGDIDIVVPVHEYVPKTLRPPRGPRRDPVTGSRAARGVRTALGWCAAHPGARRRRYARRRPARPGWPSAACARRSAPPLRPARARRAAPARSSAIQVSTCASFLAMRSGSVNGARPATLVGSDRRTA